MTVTHEDAVPQRCRSRRPRWPGARDHLLEPPARQGWWQGELEDQRHEDAEDLLLREFLGIRYEEETAGVPVDRYSRRAEGGGRTPATPGPTISAAGDRPRTSRLVALRWPALPGAPHMAGPPSGITPGRGFLRPPGCYQDSARAVGSGPGMTCR